MSVTVSPPPPSHSLSNSIPPLPLILSVTVSPPPLSLSLRAEGVSGHGGRESEPLHPVKYNNPVKYNKGYKGYNTLFAQKECLDTADEKVNLVVNLYTQASAPNKWTIII